MLLRLLTSAVTTAFAAFATARIVWAVPSPLTYAGALPMFFCIGKITYSFCLNAIGLGTFLLGREDSVNPPAAPTAPKGAPGSKVAMCLLCYNDDPYEIHGRLTEMLGMRRSEASAGFDWHVLSDTRDATIAEQERLVYATNPDAAVRYRRRVDNTDAKVGNLREFLEEHGHRYDYFCVLDADSVVDPELVVQMARILDAHPRVAIVQPNIVPVGAERMSIFSRTIEFVVQTAAHIAHVGNALVQGGRSLYVGHNCLIRTAAFVDHVLPAYAASGGRPPLSHDFVESVILARCGYEIRSVYFETGSCEALPPNLIEWVTRDHRWCRGNMEHLGLAFRLRGIGFWNRVQLSMSSLAYLSSLFWIAIVALTIGSFGYDNYARRFAVGGNGDGIGGVVWFGAALYAMLFAPPFASLLARPRALFGQATVAGIARHALALTVATAYSVLFSPIMATFHVWSIIRVVWASVFGTSSSSWATWAAQNRNSHVIGLRESVRLSLLPTLAGTALVSGLVTSNVLSSESIPVNINVLLGLTCGTVMLSSAVIHFSSRGLGRFHAWLYDNACVKTPPFKFRGGACPSHP